MEFDIILSFIAKLVLKFNYILQIFNKIKRIKHYKYNTKNGDKNLII